ncbi:hypothetical protein CAOG_06967 [Capsaspora owczarzaki ATCC 30864]|uniref:Ras GTPase-activating protein 1 n=1 Tax=Capsaspora owczarzaki (strain ATCC 30864) TaxID=595528 RepID=A0A0D2UNZ5_CAPO3|nr:hypothetical protein CAOG_06967 [Capsaspora owczarzaki ATCC 30864]KJE96686.1 hypothetical protein CAOG_006967 [Capsaspora owczarzaki ATCC 30864]|eukprot:XP_004343691.2 hypothetical protein CAOG_06967 [Capsaspora owczarzaki ATCC 30864]
MADYTDIDFDSQQPLDDFDFVDETVVGSKYQSQHSQHDAPPESEWFHGPSGREEAEKVLLKKGREGSYLIRESVRDPGDYSLSFRISTGIKHFKIINDWGDFYIGGRRFHSLGDLISYYMGTFLTGNLCLKYPVPPETASSNVSGLRNTVLALYNYTKSSTDELSFVQGDVLAVLNNDDPSWWWARIETGPAAGSVGFIPSTLVQLIEKVVPPREKWFHGKIPRKDAETMLVQQAHDGAFLVRESENQPGDFSLSFRVGNVVKHFRIESSGRQYLCGGRTFSSIDDVIARYLREPLTDNRTLVEPFPPQAKVESIYAAVDRPAVMQVAQQIAKQMTPQFAAPPPVPSRPQAGSTTTTRATTYNRCGYLVRKSRKSNKKWKKLYFALMGAKKRLYFFESENALRPKGIVDLTMSTVHSLHSTFFGRPNCFQIITNTIDALKTYYLCANTEDEQQGWLDSLKEFCGHDSGRRPVPGEEAIEIKSLQLGVMEARDLPSKISHPYCLISLDNVNQARTQIKTRAQPMWVEEFTFDDIPASCSTASIVVINKNKLQKDVEMAKFVLDLDKVRGDKPVEAWYDLKSMDDKDKEKLGGIRIKARFSNELILPFSEYLDIKSLLMHPDMQAIQAIGSVGKEREEVAKTLLRIFQADNAATELVRSLNRLEVNSTDDPNTIFRGNSLATKTMDQFMKMTAISYLHGIIGDIVKEIFEDKHSCEMDPTRLPKGTDSKDNLKRLLHWLQSIWDAVQKSIDDCPTELRVAFHSLQQDVVSRFPQDQVVRYSAVSGFIFLRLICPAILNPKLFNMMADHPSEQTSRSLTLIAKSIQNLANLVEFKSKEQFMTPVNDFIVHNRDAMKRFIDQLSTMPEYPKSFARVAPVNPARELASIYRYIVRNKEAVQKYGVDNPSAASVTDALISTCNRIANREKSYMNTEPTYQNFSN